MNVMTILQAIPGIGPVLPYLTALVALAAAIAPFVPPPSVPASGFYPIVYGAINFLAFNVGHARNATAKGETKTGEAA